MSKNKQILYVIFSLFFISCSSQNFDSIEGNWIAKGYSCENKVGLSEEIKITKKNKTIFAIKLTGDNCIQAGDTTWYGELRGDKIFGEIKGVNSQTLDYEWMPCEIVSKGKLLILSINKHLVLQMKKDTKD